ASPARLRARPGAAGTRTRRPPTATTRRTATCRSTPRTACASGGRSRARPPAGGASRSEHRDEVERAVERPAPQREVASRDGGREAVVEGLSAADGAGRG